METIDAITGRAYKVKYRKLRITKITDLRAAHKLLVDKAAYKFFDICPEQPLGIQKKTPGNRNGGNIEGNVTPKGSQSHALGYIFLPMKVHPVGRNTCFTSSAFS